MSISHFKFGLLITIALVMASMPLQAADDKSATFKDWGYKCEKPQGSENELCFIFQRITSTKDDKRIADVTIAYLPKVDDPVMVVTLPLGVFLPAGIQMQIDEEKEGIRAPYIQCIQDGCQARAKLDSKLASKMKGGKSMIVAFLTPQQKQLAFPISLNGFTAAFGNLKK